MNINVLIISIISLSAVKKTFCKVFYFAELLWKNGSNGYCCVWYMPATGCCMWEAGKLQLVHKINVIFKSLTVMKISILRLHPASNSQIIRIGNYPLIWSLNYSYHISLALLQKNLVGGNSLHSSSHL